MASVPPQEKNVDNLGALVPFVLNFGLFIYTGYKLCRLTKSSNKSKAAVLSRNYRTFVFLLIFLSSILRCGVEAHLIYSYYSNTSPGTIEDNIIAIFDKLPILLYISIATIFSNFWHEIYSNFEDDVAISNSHTKYGLFIGFFNILLYLIYSVLAIINFVKQGNEGLNLAIYGTLFSGLVVATLTIITTGKRLHDRAVKLVSYAGQHLKSTNGFRSIYFLLISSCVIKCLQQAFLAYAETKDFQYSPVQSLGVEGTLYYVYDIAYVVIVYALGEWGFFIGLITILNIYANKSQTFLTDETDRHKRSLSEIFYSKSESFNP